MFQSTLLKYVSIYSVEICLIRPRRTATMQASPIVPLTMPTIPPSHPLVGGRVEYHPPSLHLAGLFIVSCPCLIPWWICANLHRAFIVLSSRHFYWSRKWFYDSWHWPTAILGLATNFWLLVLSILHNHKRIIKQSSLSHWVAEYNFKVSSVVVQNGEHE